MANRRVLPFLLLAALAGPSLAADNIVSLILPDFDQQVIVASIISVEATATEYFLACTSGEPDDECGLGPGITVKEGPSTLEIRLIETAFQTVSGLTESSAYTAEASCVISGDTATCSQVFSGLDVEGGSTIEATVSSRLETISGLSSYLLPVTITAGLEKLTAGAGGGSGGGGGTTARPTQTVGSGAITTATGSGAGQTAGSGGSGSGSSSSSSKNAGAMPMVTQPAAVIAGVVAVIGGAAILL